jgi:hypothetical protein
MDINVEADMVMDYDDDEEIRDVPTCGIQIFVCK